MMWTEISFQTARILVRVVYETGEEQLRQLFDCSMQFRCMSWRTYSPGTPRMNLVIKKERNKVTVCCLVARKKVHLVCTPKQCRAVNQARKKRLQNINCWQSYANSNMPFWWNSFKGKFEKTHTQAHTLGMHRKNKDKRRKRRQHSPMANGITQNGMIAKRAQNKYVCHFFVVSYIFLPFPSPSIFRSSRNPHWHSRTHTHTHSLTYATYIWN